jgi:VanZ family protein
VDEKNLLKRFIGYTMMGLPVAAITEFVQYFIPGRTGTLGDVMIDMIGYYLGTLLVVVIALIVKGIKLIVKLIKKKAKKEKVEE